MNFQNLSVPDGEPHRLYYTYIEPMHGSQMYTLQRKETQLKQVAEINLLLSIHFIRNAEK